MSVSDDSDQGSARRMLSKTSVLTEDQKKVCNVSLIILSSGLTKYRPTILPQNKRGERILDQNLIRSFL